MTVKKVQSESGRFLYRVSDLCLYPEEKPDVYERDTFTCFLSPRHCSCDAFLEHVVIDSSRIMVSKQRYASCFCLDSNGL